MIENPKVSIKSIDLPKGVESIRIQSKDGVDKLIPLLSFRERKHEDLILQTLLVDNPVAFHGWGVSGVCGRVDEDSNFLKFWELKRGRLPGSKIPLLEPPEYIADHVDWNSVHPNFRFLRETRGQKSLWRATLPFHLIFPYQENGNSLSKAVVTPAYDQEVASDIPVPTVCFFWAADPALKHLVQRLKKEDSRIQLGVSSLNQPGEIPPFKTEDLIDYLVKGGITDYDVIISDPLLEPLDIASSHSQFKVPLVEEEPVWTMMRRGSLSAQYFERYTHTPVKEHKNMKIAARKHTPDVNLDKKLEQAIKRIRVWQLKSLLHLV